MEGKKDLFVCMYISIYTYYIYTYIVSTSIFIPFSLGIEGRLEVGRERIQNHLFSEFQPHLPNLNMPDSYRDPSKNILILENMK